ncbi:hypothetical protein SQH80_13190 [Enterococcus faecium]|uniref:hypothetical protein n=1 Tax=Enterococcus faecium TaxID=1352 RepID=UPI002FDBE909
MKYIIGDQFLNKFHGEYSVIEIIDISERYTRSYVCQVQKFDGKKRFLKEDKLKEMIYLGNRD